MKKTILLFCLTISSYFAQAQITYVDAAASGANNGTSWANAYTNLQTAIAITGSGEIWVKAGTYYPGASGNNSASFSMKDNVSILGGFNGTETLNSQRNPITNITILSGDLDQSNSPTANDAYHVLNTGNAGSSALIDGFTITRGNAVGAGEDANGAGIYSKPSLSGAYSPIIKNCSITMNVANGNGGAVYIGCDQSGGNSTGTQLINCSMFFTTAGAEGGAIAITSSGALAFAIPTIENCVFYSNGASSDGNIISAVASSSGEVHVQVTNCTLFGNNLNSEVKYIANGSNSSFNIDNTIAFGLDFYSDASFTVNNSDADSPYFTGAGNINTDPIFMNQGATDFRLRCYSPCIDTGNNTAPTQTQDINGAPRNSGANPDMGAYETNYATPVVIANASSVNVCNGDLVTLFGSGTPGYNYSWTGGVIFDNAPFVPLTTNTYTLTGTDAFYCTATQTITVVVNPIPTVIANASSMYACEGSNITFFGTGTATTYSWNGGIIDNVPSPLFSNTSLIVTGTDAFGCSASDNITVNIEQQSGTSAGADLNVCLNNTSVVLNGINNSSGTFQWTELGTGSLDDPNILNPTYTFSPGDIALGYANIAYQVTPSICPIFNDTVTVFLRSLPSVALPADYMICETDSIFLNTTVTGGTPPYLYNWGNGGTISTANNEYYTPIATSNISLYLLDNFGCVATDTVVVYIDGSEIISGTAYLGAGVLTSGNVHLIKYYPQPQLFDTLITTTLDGAGNYSFPPIPHGNYIVSVEPDTILFPNALITYLGDQTRSELANILGHNCTSPVIASLNVQQLLSGTGTGSISGEVVEWDGFGFRYNGSNNHIMVPGGPLKGIDVKLGKNPGGGIQARTSSNNLGKYNFNNLPNGNYNIYVDIPGLPMDSFYVVNVVSDSTTNLIYYADSNSVFPILPTAVGIKDYKTEQMGMGVHPNPATNYTTVLFETMTVNSSTQIKVFDVTGKIAMNLKLTNLPKGKHEYHLNFANQQLQSGIYFIELINEKGKQTKKLIVE